MKKFKKPCKKCRNEEGTRKGLGRKCYDAFRGMVKRGETTWEELEKLGFCESSPRGRPVKFKKDLERRRAQFQKQKAIA